MMGERHYLHYKVIVEAQNRPDTLNGGYQGYVL